MKKEDNKQNIRNIILIMIIVVGAFYYQGYSNSDAPSNQQTKRCKIAALSYSGSITEDNLIISGAYKGMLVINRDDTIGYGCEYRELTTTILELRMIKDLKDGSIDFITVGGKKYNNNHL